MQHGAESRGRYYSVLKDAGVVLIIYYITKVDETMWLHLFSPMLQTCNVEEEEC